MMVGEAFRGLRDKVKIATKFGWDIDQDTGEHRGGVNSKPAQIRRAVEGSLKRLGSDYIDLYYQHRVDPDVPMEDVAGVGQRPDPARQGSLFRPLGGRARNPFAALMPCSPSTALQSEYSLWTREPEDGDHPDARGTRNRHGPVQPARQRLSHRHDRRRARRSTNVTSAAASHALRPMPATPINASSICCAKSATGTGQPPRRSRSPGFSPRSHGSCRCLGPASSSGSRKTLARCPCS